MLYDTKSIRHCIEMLRFTTMLVTHNVAQLGGLTKECEGKKYLKPE